MAKRKIDIEDHRDLSNHEGIEYEFYTERGFQCISYAEYLADLDLRAKINDMDRYRLVLGRTIYSYSMKYLAQKPEVRKILESLEEEQRLNPLRFFAPSGKQALNFLNDHDNTLCIMTACNRFGKTQTMLVKKLINNIPCDPNWEIFTKYGVNHRKFRGAKNIGLASYELDFHTDTLLPMILDWCPKKELGKYAKDFKGKGARKVTMRVDPTLELECGTKFMFSAMSQSQGKFEGNVKHDWGWDEQGSEAAFDGADERTRTFSGGRHDFAMTPHKVEGRPDTGAGSWINKLYSGETTKGHSIKTYQGQVWDVPDWIYPESSKLQAFNKWVKEPMETLNEKARREGESRFFGKWHESSGLVIDEWDSSVHVIEPFDIPDHWTWYRGLDHGTKHPAAALQCAVSPAGDLFICEDFLRTGLVVSQIADEVIEWSGNSRKKIGTYRNPKNDMVYDKYQEDQHNRSFRWTVFDPRAWSASQNESGLLLHKLYELYGLKMKKGSGKDSDHYVPILKEWFFVDPKKPHFVTGEMGAPRVYVFNTCHEFIKTIKRWVWAERKTKSTDRLAKESPTKVDDDLMDVLKYIIQANPTFRGNARMSDRMYYDGIDDYDDVPRHSYKPENSITGY
jgi:hypothetical protein